MKLSDRQKQTIDKLKSIDSGNDFFWDDKTGSAKFIKGRLSKPSKDEPEKIARAFLEDNAGLLDVQEDLTESLEVSHIEKDKQGYSHVYFAQSLNSIPVFEGSTQVHINPDGEVIAYKDYRLAALDVSREPRITEQDAREIFLKDCGIESQAMTGSPHLTTCLLRPELRVPQSRGLPDQRFVRACLPAQFQSRLLLWAQESGLSGRPLPVRGIHFS